MSLENISSTFLGIDYDSERWRQAGQTVEQIWESLAKESPFRWKWEFLRRSKVFRNECETISGTKVYTKPWKHVESTVYFTGMFSKVKSQTSDFCFVWQLEPPPFPGFELLFLNPDHDFTTLLQSVGYFLLVGGLDKRKARSELNEFIKRNDPKEKSGRNFKEFPGGRVKIIKPWVSG